MDASDSILVFFLDEQRYAFSLSAVERVIPMVAVTPLPRAPGIVHGIIDVHGSLIPVYNIRKRFGRAERDYEISDVIILSRTKKHRVAVPADAIQEVMKIPGIAVDAGEILPSLPYVHGVVKLPDGLILIHDLDTFLSPDEEDALEEALSPAGEQE